MLTPQQETEHFPFPSQKLFGFIILRHVNSVKTNVYWNLSIKHIRTHYPLARIMLIDDNSNAAYLHSDHNYRNVFLVQSEFPGRGELLPFYYFLKYKPFEYAVIVHDSVFFHAKLNFLYYIQQGVPFIPLWTFVLSWDTESQKTKTRLLLSQMSVSLNNKIANFDSDFELFNFASVSNMLMNRGCFGCMGLYSYSFLNSILNTNSKIMPTLLANITTRLDRCMFERLLFFLLFDKLPQHFKLNPKFKSILGNIHGYCPWAYTYEHYIEHMRTHDSPPNPIVKVWTGR